MILSHFACLCLSSTSVHFNKYSGVLGNRWELTYYVVSTVMVTYMILVVCFFNSCDEAADPWTKILDRGYF